MPPGRKLLLIIENTSRSPAASVTYPESALTAVIDPVLPCRLLAAGVLRMRLRSVPPVKRSGFPAMGSALYQLVNHGLPRAAISRLVICCGVNRSARDSPEPSTRRTCDASTPIVAAL